MTSRELEISGRHSGWVWQGRGAPLSTRLGRALDVGCATSRVARHPFVLLPEGVSLGEQRLDRRQERLLDARTKRQGSLNIGSKPADIEGLLLNSRRWRWLLHEPERFKELVLVSQNEGGVLAPAPGLCALRAAVPTTIRAPAST